MKLLKWAAIGAAILLLCLGGGYMALRYQAPTYGGVLKLKGLQEDVEVYFDTYGIPHIYASNEKDAQFALGYVHAQDRLFQMEMIRRLGSGTLAEILGPSLAETDRFFRTAGVHQTALKAMEAFEALPADDPMKKAALAYYQGVNTFVEEGETPIEFYILGIPKRPFSVTDAYDILGYMAFSFAQAFRTDPLVTRIQQQYGDAYLNDLDLHWNPQAQMIPVWGRDSSRASEALMSEAFGVLDLVKSFPVPPWIGSNSWVIAPSKTKSGKVILSNDTHIAFAQPSVWYEAHLEYPGVSNYGYYLGGIPFSILAHSRFMAIGVTMFENDDIDLYQEKINPDNPQQVWFKDKWEEMEIREEIVKVKDAEDLVFEVKLSRHGPIINDALEDVSNLTDQPVSMWWVYNEFVPQTLQATYKMSKASSMEEAREGVAMGHAPGLNIMYGDIEGNIAWWTMAKLPKRPAHVNSKLILDGSSGEDEILGYFDFADNPQSENPTEGFLYSANNQPDSSGGVLHAGYYIPQDRAKHIVDLLSTDKKWDMASTQEMVNTVQSPSMQKTGQKLAEILAATPEMSPEQKKVLAVLETWDGDNQLTDIGPTIYSKLMYHLSKMIFLDELGEHDFETFLSTHLFKRSLPFLVENEASPWWDNLTTSDEETRADIVSAAFRVSVEELYEQLGADISTWKWETVHHIEHPHPLGQVEAMKPAFNVGPFPVSGNIETINNMMFKLNASGKYEVLAGPATRRIIDFSDLEHSMSILPTGQSGNVMSPHYSDQAQMFVDGKFRLMMMNQSEIQSKGMRKRLLKAKK